MHKAKRNLTRWLKSVVKDDEKLKTWLTDDTVAVLNLFLFSCFHFVQHFFSDNSGVLVDPIAKRSDYNFGFSVMCIRQYSNPVKLSDVDLDPVGFKPCRIESTFEPNLRR